MGAGPWRWNVRALALSVFKMALPMGRVRAQLVGARRRACVLCRAGPLEGLLGRSLLFDRFRIYLGECSLS